MEAEKRSLYFNAPGFRSQEIEIAPEIDPKSSKRQPLISKEDSSLDTNLTDLDQGTRHRNRVFQERLDEIWKLSAAWEAKLRTEAKESVETILNLKDQYQQHLTSYRTSIFDELNSIFDKVDKEILPHESQRLDTIEHAKDVFFQQVVPERIEQQSGEVSRQLKRAYETFDIEKKKEEKRETKVVVRASKHVQRTSQKFEDEDAFLSSAFNQLEDDVIEYERRAARMHALKNEDAIGRTVALQHVAQDEALLRQSEDVEVLDTVIETQRLLQNMILLHFGTRTDELFAAEQPPGDFPKLQQRLDHIHNKQHKAENKDNHST